MKHRRLFPFPRPLLGARRSPACWRGPGRVALTVLGTVIGIAALVATLGLSKTASNQIQGRFDAVEATDVVVSPAAGARRRSRASCPSARRRGCSGSTASSPRAASPTSTCAATSPARSPVNDPQRPSQVQLTVQAASPGLWRAVRAHLLTGRFPDAGHSRARRPRGRARAQRGGAAQPQPRRPAAGGVPRRSALPDRRDPRPRRAPALAAGLAGHARRDRGARVRPAGTRAGPDRDEGRRGRPDRAPGAARR